MSGRTLILGIGNILWADEGFGVRCVEAFDAAFQTCPDVELMDGGTQGLYLVQHVADADDVLVFDALDYGAEPGTLKIVRGEDVPSFIAQKKMSLHQLGFSDVLACADLLGRKPRRLTVIGAQPVELDDYGGSLTPRVKALIPRAVELAAQELRDWGFDLRARRAGEAGVMTPALALDAYEAARPQAHEACRTGDERFLHFQAAE